MTTQLGVMLCSDVLCSLTAFCCDIYSVTLCFQNEIWVLEEQEASMLCVCNRACTITSTLEMYECCFQSCRFVITVYEIWCG